jgi:hypothetical protein
MGYIPSYKKKQNKKKNKVSNKQNTSLHWDDEIYHRLVSLKI